METRHSTQTERAVEAVEARHRRSRVRGRRRGRRGRDPREAARSSGAAAGAVGDPKLIEPRGPPAPRRAAEHDAPPVADRADRGQRDVESAAPPRSRPRAGRPEASPAARSPRPRRRRGQRRRARGRGELRDARLRPEARASSISSPTPLAAARWPASPPRPSLRSIIAVAPPRASASPAASRGRAASWRGEGRRPPAVEPSPSSGRSSSSRPAAAPPSSPVTTTTSPGPGAPARRTGVAGSAWPTAVVAQNSTGAAVDVAAGDSDAVLRRERADPVGELEHSLRPERSAERRAGRRPRRPARPSRRGPRARSRAPLADARGREGGSRK